MTVMCYSRLIDLFYLNQNNQVGIYRLKTYKILLVGASLFLFFKDDSETERERESQLKTFFLFSKPVWIENNCRENNLISSEIWNKKARSSEIFVKFVVFEK